ncbi:MAG: 6-pyruvoyl-tetrahydropterin synthase-related protein [Syntrophomonadaceae bacterium]|nr:6-pyruvoyl-tetrahydropterin synthase-related protein [Syntrophomonadaceae bacterium]
MGHLTRLDYLGDCLREGNWPSWFPYWYCGSTVLQYYPPLSFLMVVPVQIIFDNVMISFKFIVFIYMFIGAMGAWYFGYRLIGRGIGLLGGVLYACQPFLLRTLVLQGAVAQGPIFAITPWLLVFSLLLLEGKTFKIWILVSMLCTLLILSHAMHAYLVGLGIGILILILVIIKRYSISDLILWVIAMGIGAGIGAFWILPGVTNLENPLIPYLLPEVAAAWASNLSWFNPNERMSSGWYPSTAMVLTAFWPYFLTKKSKQGYFIKSLIVVMVLSICFSMGYKFPLIRILPLNTSLVSMRFLSFSMTIAIILIMYLFYEVTENRKAQKYFYINFLILFIVIIIIAVDINPRNMPIRISPMVDLQQNIEEFSKGEKPFEQGRLTWLTSSLGCQLSYFPMVKGMNMADGWNIEGTPHNRTLWLHNIAIPNHCDEYVVKNLLQWNTRSIFISKNYYNLLKDLEKNGFNEISSDQENIMLYNTTPSSYFMKTQRNTLSIGRAASRLVMNFPWIIQGRTTCLEDYAPEELNRFKIFYLIEPEVKNFLRFQEIVEELAQSGKTVIVEWGRADRWPLFDVVPYTEPILPGARLEARPESPIPWAAGLDPDPRGQVFAIGKLDGVWHTMRVGEVDAPVIGYKNVGGNRVYFVGLALGQQLNSGHGAEIRAILEELIDLGQPYKSIVPNPFPVSDADWRHDGFSFRYSSEQPTPVWVSVTYTPRWKATVDGLPVKVYNLENLILVDLPAGEHTVNFKYGMTWVGWLGIGLSLLTALITVIIYFNFERLNNFLDRAVLKARQAVESIGS